MARPRAGRQVPLQTEKYEKARASAFELDWTVTTGMIINEIKRDNHDPDLIGHRYQKQAHEYLEEARKQAYEQAQLWFSQSPTSDAIVVVVSAGALFQWAVFLRGYTCPATPTKDGTYQPTPERESRIARRDVPLDEVIALHMEFQTTISNVSSLEFAQVPDSPTTSPPRKRQRQEGTSLLLPA
ncbi:hypothetical protein BD413DRAFT_552700 [Trametes elegans]|nr:hypothetical protein BD413DRAFT_552700 [Trametes elegans]